MERHESAQGVSSSAPTSSTGRRGGISIIALATAPRARTTGIRSQGLFYDDDPPDRATIEFNKLFHHGSSAFEASTKQWHEGVVKVLNRPPTAERSAIRRLAPIKNSSQRRISPAQRFTDVIKIAKERHREAEGESLIETHHMPVQESITIGDLKKFEFPNSKSNLCFKCWALVPAEPQSLSCLYCPVVAHVECARTIHRDAKEALGMAASAINKTRVAAEVSRHREGASDGNEAPRPDDDVPGDMEASPQLSVDTNKTAQRRTSALMQGIGGGANRHGARRTKWACPFCVEEVHRHNDYYRKKNEERTFDPEVEIKMITTVQSVVRMMLARRKWAKRLLSAIKIQRFYRSRGVQLQTRDELKMQKRSVAFAIHEVELCLDLEKAPNDGISGERLRQETLRLGDFGCLMLDRYLHTFPQDQPTLLPMIDLIYESMHSPLVIIQPIEKVYPPGTLFMSITIHDNMEFGKQIYRVDLPLGALSDKALEKISRKSPMRLNLSNIPATARREGILVGAPGVEIESILLGSKADRRVWVTLRPVVRGVSLFPACSADVTVRFTVSEVIKWPNSLTLGRSEYNLIDTLIAKEVVMFAQTLEKPMRGDDPVMIAPHCRLSVNDHQAGVQKKKITYVPGLGKILWSVVPLSSASCITGPLVFLKSAIVKLKTSHSKRNWCCVVHKVLRVYAAPHEIVVRESVDLTKCQATLIKEVRKNRYNIASSLRRIHFERSIPICRWFIWSSWVEPRGLR
jgi:hypothetical protein